MPEGHTSHGLARAMAALIDQTVLAGVGNVFRAETLHACRTAPDRPADAVSPAEFDQLWCTLISMMTTAVDEDRIITVDAEDRPAVPEDQSRPVHRRQNCYDWGTPVVTSTVGSGTSYTGPRRQVR